MIGPHLWWRQAYTERFNLPETTNACRLLTIDFMHQLAKCKDDHARRLLLGISEEFQTLGGRMDSTKICPVCQNPVGRYNCGEAVSPVSGEKGWKCRRPKRAQKSAETMTDAEFNRAVDNLRKTGHPK